MPRKPLVVQLLGPLDEPSDDVAQGNNPNRLVGIVHQPHAVDAPAAVPMKKERKKARKRDEEKKNEEEQSKEPKMTGGMEENRRDFKKEAKFINFWTYMGCLYASLAMTDSSESWGLQVYSPCMKETQRIKRINAD